MRALKVPEPLRNPESGWAFLAVYGSMDFPVDDLREMKAALGDREHMSFAVQVEEDERSAVALTGSVGVHPDLDDDDIEPWFHYVLTLRSDARVAEKSTEEWNQLLEVCRALVPKHTMRARLRVGYPDLSSFAFPLPMPLDSAGVPGFSEIRGVRLVEPDPEDPTAELYSVIIDGDLGDATADVSATIDASFDDELFSVAAKRCLSVLELAVPTEPES